MLITRAAIVVLGLAPIVRAEEPCLVNPENPVWCPPLNCVLTPTLVDWIFGAGTTSR
jgi:hypothetical protein